MRRAAALALMLLLSACGFTPLYSSNGGDTLGVQLAQIRVAPVSDITGDAYAKDYYRQGRTTRLGQLLQDGLERRLTGDFNAPYRLQVSIEERIEGIGIRSDESFTRQRISLIARYEVLPVGSDVSLYKGEAKSDIGVDRVRSEYATLTAERAASERNAQLLVQQITAKVALALRGKLTGGDGLSVPVAPTVSTTGSEPVVTPTPPNQP
jgi:LPS-assembly lipoprotein